MAYKLPQRLSKEAYAIHIQALKDLQSTAPARGKKNVPIAETREHLEPLLRHWPLFGSTSTVPLMAARLQEETGIQYNPSTLNMAIKDWQLTPANAHSRGAAKTQPAQRLGFKR